MIRHPILFLKCIFCFWLCWVFVFTHGLSLVALSRGYSLVELFGLLIAAAFLVVEHRLQGTRASVVVAHGFISCISRTLELRLKQLWHTGLVVLQHVGSSHTRDRTVFPALQGRFLTIGSPGKPRNPILINDYYKHWY